MFQSLWRQSPQYSLIGGKKETGTVIWSTILRRTLVTYFLVVLLAAGTGFWAGKYSNEKSCQVNIECEFSAQTSSFGAVIDFDFSATVDLKPQIFQYNRTFGEAPSNHTDRAWNELFPEQGGFFIHPTIAPSRSAFSTFHQLHCLVGSAGYITPFILTVRNRMAYVKATGLFIKPPGKAE